MDKCYMCGKELIEGSYRAIVDGKDIYICAAYNNNRLPHMTPCAETNVNIWQSIYGAGDQQFNLDNVDEAYKAFGQILTTILEDPSILYSL